MFDIDKEMTPEAQVSRLDSVQSQFAPGQGFLWTKRLFDIVIALCLLPWLFLFGFVLLLLNPFFNRGPLFFIQTRMGQHCEAFRAVKFRTMTEVNQPARRADDPLEHDRITPLGHFLRRSRIDEVPQILNVLVGQMSMIGPRPDYFDHAQVYLDVVPGYRERHVMKPGISGLAQTELGYVEGLAETERKASVDLYYIRNASLKLDCWVFWRTLCVVLGRGGK
jgi:lipopolysaccharide/colanic/teichoic acid biosynthesis glycosyltransferase